MTRQTDGVEFRREVQPDGPWTWAVLWGAIGRGRLRREEVTAWDVDEALHEGGLRHPEWERPKIAFLLDGPELPEDHFER